MASTKHKPELKADIPYSEMADSTRLSPEEEILKNPSIIGKINNLLKFFNETGIRYGDFDIDPEDDPLKGLRRSDTYNKKAYPNTDYYVHIAGSHNTQKWLQAVREVYYKERNGANRVLAIKQATSGWNPMETYDFLNWLRYYEAGTHLKYKFAQLWYENNTPGYFLHVKPDSKKEESSVEGKDIDMARDVISNEMSSSEKKHIIEKQRNKIVGRLDSAEKLLRTHHGQVFAGKEFETLLEAIYQLKKKLQMVNKISTSTKIYEDMIIREANILNKKGFIKAGKLLLSLSRANNPPPEGLGDTSDKLQVPLTSVSPTPPQQGSGTAGGLPSMGPGMPQTPTENSPNNTPPPKGISGFLENLDVGSKDNNFSDILEVEDTLDVDEFITQAQDIAAPSITPITPPLTDTSEKINKPLEVKDNVSKINNSDKISPQNRDFDNMIDSLFSHISINDIVAKLEDISKIYKTREIPRQLSIIDMMLDSKGLAAYFPSLSEAINKALESNNYISTRIDDILAKLTGGIEGRDLDLKGEMTPKTNSPEIETLKQNLKIQEDKEKARKKMRKEQSDQELDLSTPEKETPQIDIEEDLSKPPPSKEQNIAPVAPTTKPVSVPK